MFVRRLGEIEGSHYVQATPVGRTPETWEHHRPEDDVVSCRWLHVRAGAEVWGLRGAFVHALVRERVVAYVTRQGPRGLDLLTIEQGDIQGGVQVPAGRLDPGESPEHGLAREVEEETGITEVSVVRRLADADEFERLYGPPAPTAAMRFTPRSPPKARTNGSTGSAVPAPTRASSTSAGGCASTSARPFGGMPIPWSRSSGGR